MAEEFGALRIEPKAIPDIEVLQPTGQGIESSVGLETL